MKNKTVLFCVTNDLVFDQRMQRICNTLATNNFDVELIGRHLPNSKNINQEKYLQTRLDCFFNKKIIFYAEFNLRLFWYLLFQKVDIICACDLDTLPAVWLATKIKNVKCVYDAHEYFTEVPELINRKKIQKIWLKIEQFLVPKIDAMYTVTQSIANIFNQKYNINCNVIRNLPNKENSTIKKENNEKYILYQGAVNIGRGIKETILAIKNIDNIKFYIAGNGDIFDEIKNIIIENRLENKVIFLGKKTPLELKKITQNAFIGINLLENKGLNYYYSLGNKTFDYIQAEIPQICINFPEYKKINDEFFIAEMIDDLDIKTIENALYKLINNTDYHTKLKQNCIKAKEILNWQNEEQTLLTIYNNL